MRETVASLTPALRRYIHALLGRWPVAGARAYARSRADQDADDIAQTALLGFWRAGVLQGRDGPSGLPAGAMRLALLRRVTRLARTFCDRDARPAEGEAGRGAHFPWSPEARALPQLSFESRALLALAALERLDYEEIGAVLDLSAAQALTRLARARADLASALSGRRECHLRPASSVCEADLHGYADDLLEPRRRAEVAALLEADDEAARRAEEWRRGAERLRGAFATLDAEPLPASLNFVRPQPAAQRRRKSKPLLKAVFARFSGASPPAIPAHF